MSKAREIAKATETLSVDGGTIKLDGNYPVGTDNVALGNQAFGANVSGNNNTAVGSLSLYANTDGQQNTAIGQSAMEKNTSGSYLTSVGYTAGYENTTGNYNTFIGHQAGRNTTTGSYNTVVGRAALHGNTTSGNNTVVGEAAGAAYYGTGGLNTLIGNGAGYWLENGAKNTIVGAFNGNQYGLDVRYASNIIALSDGDGVPAWASIKDETFYTNGRYVRERVIYSGPATGYDANAAADTWHSITAVDFSAGPTGTPWFDVDVLVSHDNYNPNYGYYGVMHCTFPGIGSNNSAAYNGPTTLVNGADGSSGYFLHSTMNMHTANTYLNQYARLMIIGGAKRLQVNFNHAQANVTPYMRVVARYYADQN